jgi:hypothetical protein
MVDTTRRILEVLLRDLIASVHENASHMQEIPLKILSRFVISGNFTESLNRWLHIRISWVYLKQKKTNTETWEQFPKFMATILVNTPPFHSKGEGKKILSEKRDFIRKICIFKFNTKNFTNKRCNKNWIRLMHEKKQRKSEER